MESMLRLVSWVDEEDRRIDLRFFSFSLQKQRFVLTFVTDYLTDRVKSLIDKESGSRVRIPFSAQNIAARHITPGCFRFRPRWGLAHIRGREQNSQEPLGSESCDVLKAPHPRDVRGAPPSKSRSSLRLHGFKSLTSPTPGIAQAAAGCAAESRSLRRANPEAACGCAAESRPNLFIPPQTVHAVRKTGTASTL